MKAFWAARTRREQALLTGLGCLVFCYMFFALLWQPLSRQQAHQVEQLARYGQMAAFLQQVGPASFQMPPLTADIPLSTLVTTTANTAGLTISRLVPLDTSVEVDLDAAEFSTVLTWIATVEQEHALQVQSVSFTRRPEPGVVATTLVLGR
jgi:general secretion pathway protein M